MDHGNVRRWRKGRLEGCGTKIAPVALHFESARTRPGTGQNGAKKHLISLIAEITERWTGSLGF